MIHVISLGAGVQSSTMALMAAHGEITPMPDCAIFADTQSEPAAVYRWLDWLVGQLPFPVHRVTAGNLGEMTTSMRTSKKGVRYWKNYIPMFCDDGKRKGLYPRKCTADFKIAVITRKLRELGAIPRGCKETRIQSWIGISTDEAHRMKPSRERWVESRWPLIERNVSRAGCLKWMERNDFPRPPRSACVFCPYHSDAEWARMKADEPEEFAKAVGMERAAAAAAKCASTFQHPFLHRSCVPLDKVPFSELAAESKAWREAQIDLFGDECEGMCGV